MSEHAPIVKYMEEESKDSPREGDSLLSYSLSHLGKRILKITEDIDSVSSMIDLISWGLEEGNELQLQTLKDIKNFRKALEGELSMRYIEIKGIRGKEVEQELARLKGECT